MKIKRIVAAFGLLTAGLSSHAHAADVDFARFLATPAGAAGVAAAVAGLGQCDSPISWDYAFDPETDRQNSDHLYLICQHYDEDDEEMYDKGVIAKFLFWNDQPHLESLTYLP